MVNCGRLLPVLLGPGVGQVNESREVGDFIKALLVKHRHITHDPAPGSECKRLFNSSLQLELKVYTSRH
jgi:hypothetical protein